MGSQRVRYDWAAEQQQQLIEEFPKFLLYLMASTGEPGRNRGHLWYSKENYICLWDNWKTTTSNPLKSKTWSKFTCNEGNLHETKLDFLSQWSSFKGVSTARGTAPRLAWSWGWRGKNLSLEGRVFPTDYFAGFRCFIRTHIRILS